MIKGYKGFNEDFTCTKNKQYEENTIFEEPKAILCEAGMHYCLNPLDVLFYYPILKWDCKLSKYANVTDLDSNLVACHGGHIGGVPIKNDKNVTKKLKIENIIPFKEYIELCCKDNTDNRIVHDFNSHYCNLLNPEWQAPFIFSFKPATEITNLRFDAQIAAFGDGVNIQNLANDVRIRTEAYHNKIINTGNHCKIHTSEMYNSISNFGSDCYIKTIGNGNVIHNNLEARNNVIMAEGNNIIINNYGENNEIICKGNHNRIYAFGRYAQVKAEKDTKVLFGIYKDNILVGTTKYTIKNPNIFHYISGNKVIESRR